MYIQRYLHLHQSIMGKLPAEGGGRGAGGARRSSRVGSRVGSRVFSTRGGLGLGSPATSLTTADEKTRRISRQHTMSKGAHQVAAAVTPSLGESSKERFHVVKNLFKPYQVGGSYRVGGWWEGGWLFAIRTAVVWTTYCSQALLVGVPESLMDSGIF